MAMSVIGQATDYVGDYSKHYRSMWKENSSKVCDDEEDIRGKIVIVTGCNTGIGKQVALQMAKRGAVVVMAVRNLEKGQEALDEIKKRLEDQEDLNLELMGLDLGEVQSIKDFVTAFQTKHERVDILINNAGLQDTNLEVKKTKDGFEQHIGVNHLGPFLLTRLLLPMLLKASSSPSRIVCLSSSNLAIAPLNFMDNDLMMEKGVKTGDYGKEQYNISKLCNSVCMMKLANSTNDMLSGGKVKLFQVCPGLVKSDVFRNETKLFRKFRNGVALGTVGLTTHQGCETVVYCALSKSILEAENSGRAEIYRFKKIWVKGNQILQGYLVSPRLGATDKLYQLSEELVGLRAKENTANEPS